MNAFFRLVVAVSVLSACILGGTEPAHAQDGDLALAMMLGAIGAMIDQDRSMPSLAGPTGVVSLPNAVTMRVDAWQTALSYQGMRASASGMYQAADDLGVWSLEAAHRVDDTAELWGNFSYATGHVGSHAWALGGKKVFTRLEGEGPFVAVGASYHRWGDTLGNGSSAGDAIRPDANVIKAFAVVSGSLVGEDWPTGLLGSVGLMHIGVDPDRNDSRSLTRPFVAVQGAVWLSELGLTELGLEYRWDDPAIDEKPVFSAAIRQVLSGELTAELGTTNASPVGTGLSAQRLFLRVSRCL